MDDHELINRLRRVRHRELDELAAKWTVERSDCLSVSTALRIATTQGEFGGVAGSAHSAQCPRCQTLVAACERALRGSKTATLPLSSTYESPDENRVVVIPDLDRDAPVRLVARLVVRYLRSRKESSGNQLAAHAGDRLMIDNNHAKMAISTDGIRIRFADTAIGGTFMLRILSSRDQPLDLLWQGTIRQVDYTFAQQEVLMRLRDSGPGAGLELLILPPSLEMIEDE